jgi:hypothetical protein
MADLWRDFWIRETGTGQQMAQLHDRYMTTMMMMTQLINSVSHVVSILTPWSGVLLKKLTDFQLVNKFLAFYGTRKFITAFTSSRHLSLSWASSIQSIPPHPNFWRSILILSSHVIYVQAKKAGELQGCSILMSALYTGKRSALRSGGFILGTELLLLFVWEATWAPE